MNVFINISDVASYIGQNKWNNTTPFERLWKKCDKNYDICLNELKNDVVTKSNELLVINSKKIQLDTKLEHKQITKRQFNIEVKKIIIEEKNVEKELNVIENKVENITLTQVQKIDKTLGKEIIKIISSSKDTDDKRKIVNATIKKLEKDGGLNEPQKKEMLKQTESLINTTHGTIKEQSAIDIFEEKYNCKLDISQQYFKLLIMTSNNINWYIGGKLDGIHKDYIVEIKNRMYGYMAYTKDYENTQIQLYLLLTNKKHAKLVEKYKNSIKITDIEKDDLYITQTLNYLKTFIKSMEKFINNTKLKMEYLNLTDDNNKEKFLNELYISDIIKTRHEDDELNRLNEPDEICLIDSDSDF